MTQYIADEAHFKEVIERVTNIHSTLWIGTVNLTGTGLGLKSTHTRNFEAGILTDDSALVEAAMNQFDAVWAGFKCKDCGRKQFCGDPIL